MNTLFPRIYILLLAGCLTWTGCSEDDLRNPLDQDQDAPRGITDYQVESLPGGAKISYALPDDPDILYVHAEYQIRPGVTLQAMSSFYEKYVLVQGFRDTRDYEVALYTVDRAGNRSTPTRVKINPLTAPVQLAYDSLHYHEDFGGITINFVNEPKADISITVLVRDSLGEWTDFDKFYTGQARGRLAVRGLPSEPTTFGIFVTDNWDNNSDTLVQQLTPYFEAPFDKGLYREFSPRLPGDSESGWRFAGLWDDNSILNLNTGGFTNSEGFPKWFSFDLGVTGKISRFKIWGVHDGREFSGGNIKTFEVWGSNNPAPDGSFDGWTRLGEYEVVKPSGLPVGSLTNEDRELAAAGIEFPVSVNAEPTRYIRFKILSTFASPPGAAIGSTWLMELGFWGQQVD